MPCNCRKRVVYQVVMPDGTIRRYSTEAEARAAATATGGEYQAIER